MFAVDEIPEGHSKTVDFEILCLIQKDFFFKSPFWQIITVMPYICP